MALCVAIDFFLDIFGCLHFMISSTIVNAINMFYYLFWFNTKFKCKDVAVYCVYEYDRSSI